MTFTARRLSAGLLLSACALSLAACSAGPTYGTGTSAGRQLFDDIDGLVTLGSTNRQEISYAPRPELVRPASIGPLPAPRESSARADDPNWPQSPEAIRARNIAEAEARGTDLARNPSAGTGRVAGQIGSSPSAPSTVQDEHWIHPNDLAGQRQQALAARATATQGSPTQRRYLSEPPITYRQPASTAPVGEVGVDEKVKERRAQGTRSVGSRIRDALPF